LNFRAMSFEPVNEAGVCILFGMAAADLGFYVEEAQERFPDCVVRRYNGLGWARLVVEFEHLSRNFFDHRHDPAEVDLIVCWRHNWTDCPVEVLELSREIKRLSSLPVARPA